ncbi:MAG: hypothetical protein KA801_02705 [Syntrophorhabdaceae bacterium]|nr:hypothetical protein [Syntrophorhabdaceae bacterium]
MKPLQLLECRGGFYVDRGLTNTIVTGEDLHSLARRRSARVLETLVRSGQVEAGRLFVVDPKSLAPQKKDKLKDSRVEFKLK